MSIMFVDESGDLGRATVSDGYFVMVGVVVNAEEADVVNVTMNELRERIGWHDEMEFKFAKTRGSILQSLARTVSRCDYLVYAIIVNKESYGGKNVRLLYNQVLVELVRLAGQNDLKIVIDGKAGKKYRKNTATYVRQKLSDEYRIKGIKYRESQKENILQLADLFAGYIHNKVTKGRKSSAFKDTLSQKITRISEI